MTSPYLVQQYLSRSAKNNPEQTAIRCRNQSLSYAQLDVLSNAFARHLKRASLPRASFVPVFVEKSTNAVTAIFSILKADCAYVPLDTNSPSDRIRQIIAACEATHVIVDDRTESIFNAIRDEHDLSVHCVNLDRLGTTDSAPLEYANLSIDVAYTLFTSGSTGVPKGVMISHQMIVDYIEWCLETYDITAQDRVANHAPLYFDNSTFDIYTAMAAGAQLYLVPPDLNRVMPMLIPWIQDNRITVFFCVPSVLAILQRSGKVVGADLSALRHVIAAGEVLRPEVVRYWMQQCPGAQLTNMYGPTEITVDCTYHVITEVPGENVAAIPIGRPRRNMEVKIRLEDGTLSTEPGSEGELVVRGMSVAYGYLNESEKTRNAFIQNPDHNRFHDPVYLTGDLARINESGQFDYLGRMDDQIKYLGNRIELGEIEAALGKLSDVLESVAVFNGNAPLEKQFLGALVILEQGAAADAVLKAAQATLPDYMAPRRVRAVEEFPRTSNGKIDRKAALNMLLEGSQQE